MAMLLRMHTRLTLHFPMAPPLKVSCLETGPLAVWLWNELREHDLPVICLDARHAHAALKMRPNKTDRNEAASSDPLLHHRNQLVRRFGPDYCCFTPIRSKSEAQHGLDAVDVIACRPALRRIGRDRNVGSSPIIVC